MKDDDVDSGREPRVALRDPPPAVVWLRPRPRRHRSLRPRVGLAGRAGPRGRGRGAAVVLWLFSVLSHFLFLLVWAWLFATALEPEIRWPVQRGRSRGVSTALLGGSAVFLVLGLAIVFGQLFFNQITDFVDGRPRPHDLGDRLGQPPVQGQPRPHQDRLPAPSRPLAIATWAGSLSGGVLGVVGSLSSVLFDLVTVRVFGSLRRRRPRACPRAGDVDAAARPGGLHHDHRDHDRQDRRVRRLQDRAVSEWPRPVKAARTAPASTGTKRAHWRSRKPCGRRGSASRPALDPRATSSLRLDQLAVAGRTRAHRGRARCDARRRRPMGGGAHPRRSRDDPGARARPRRAWVGLARAAVGSGGGVRRAHRARGHPLPAPRQHRARRLRARQQREGSESGTPSQWPVPDPRAVRRAPGPPESTRTGQLGSVSRPSGAGRPAGRAHAATRPRAVGRRGTRVPRAP